MNTYKTFENASLLKDYKALLSMSLEEVEAIKNSWEETRLFNNKTRNENEKECLEEVSKIAQDLDLRGIEVYKRNKQYAKTKEFQKWFNLNIYSPLKSKYRLTSFPAEPRTSCYISFDYSVNIEGVIINQVNSSDLVQIWKEVNYQFKIKTELVKKENKEYQKAIKYAIENNIELAEDLSIPKIISTVTEIASQKWLEENYTEGEMIQIDCCSDCADYIYGEHRCSCGNRRISTYVEGTIGEFYLVTEAY